MTDDGQPTIAYSVADILARIEGHVEALGQQFSTRFDRLEAKLDTKADRADVDEMNKRLTAADHAAERRITLLETAEERRAAARAVRERHESDSVQSRRWLWPTVISAVSVAAMIATVIITLLASSGK